MHGLVTQNFDEFRPFDQKDIAPKHYSSNHIVQNAELPCLIRVHKPSLLRGSHKPQDKTGAASWGAASWDWDKIAAVGQIDCCC